MSVDVPRTGYGLKSDEATYVAAALSAAYDGDLAFDRNDLERFAGLYHQGPEGIFLKRGKVHAHSHAGSFPFVHRVKREDPNPNRLYFGKSIAYSVAAAPFVRCFGLNGLLLFHVLLLAAAAVAAYAFLVRAVAADCGGDLRDRVPRRVRAAGLRCLPDAGDLQLHARGARVLLLAVQRSRAGVASRTAVDRCRRGRSPGHRHLFEADADRRAGGADRAAGVATATLAAWRHARRCGRCRGVSVLRVQRRGLGRVQLSGRRSEVLRAAVPVRDPGVDVGVVRGRSRPTHQRPAKC